MVTPGPTTMFDAFCRQLGSAGFNLVGVLDGPAYDALCPPAFQRTAAAPSARSAIVVASGGRALWEAIGQSPEAHDAHRINRFARRTISRAAADLDGSSCLFPTEPRDGAFLPIMSLAIACGLGVPSRLALLIHPAYGLWLGLRAVVLTAVPVEPTPPLAVAGFDPCAGCHAPCTRVCHGQVLTDAGYDSAACLTTRIRRRPCRRTCDARLACPVGSAHQYAADQLAHHARHLLSPATLARYGLFTVASRWRTRAQASGASASSAGSPPPA